MSDWQDLYSEVKRRKESALNKKDVVKAVEKYGKVLAIKGRFEKLEKVIPHMYASEKKIINPEEISECNLTEYDIVFIGCPGENIPNAGLIKIKDYVDLNGGYLITTDWALRTIVENLFPGFIRWNEKKTSDMVVSCQIFEPNHPFLEGLLSEIQQEKWIKSTKGLKRDEFRWWLETKSFPIQVLNSKAVHILIVSWEIRDKWGEAPVLVYFDYGKNGGRIIHMISHAHLQKGGAKGKYASALILTNILDEKISKKVGLSKPQGNEYVSDWESNQTHSQQNSLEKSLEDNMKSRSQDNYLNPAISGGLGLTETSQIIEVSLSDLSFNRECVICGNDLGEYGGKKYICKACGTPYHENCLNQQMNEGNCKKCGRILLW